MGLFQILFLDLTIDPYLPLSMNRLYCPLLYLQPVSSKYSLRIKKHAKNDGLTWKIWNIIEYFFYQKWIKQTSCPRLRYQCSTPRDKYIGGVDVFASKVKYAYELSWMKMGIVTTSLQAQTGMTLNSSAIYL